MPPVDLLMVLTSVALAVGRIVGFHDPSFQAIAHLIVGGLFGAWLISRRSIWFYLALGLTVVETVCFVAARS